MVARCRARREARGSNRRGELRGRVGLIALAGAIRELVVTTDPLAVKNVAARWR